MSEIFELGIIPPPPPSSSSSPFPPPPPPFDPEAFLEENARPPAFYLPDDEVVTNVNNSNPSSSWSSKGLSTSSSEHRFANPLEHPSGIPRRSTNLTASNRHAGTVVVGDKTAEPKVTYRRNIFNKNNSSEEEEEKEKDALDSQLPNGVSNIQIEPTTFQSALPNHSFRTVFDALRARVVASTTPLNGTLTPDRIANQMENLLFSADATQRAIKWMPSAGDVVIVSSPNCGQSLVERMVRLLCAGSDEVFNDVASNFEEMSPWIESAACDLDPGVLTRSQPGQNRVFRTCMAHSMLSMKINTCSKAKFIAVFRDPVHLRASWYSQLRSFYIKYQMEMETGTSSEQWSNIFDSTFTMDDFIKVPVTLMQSTFHSSKQGMEYEYNLREWITISASKKNCMIVFIEDALTRPDLFVTKLADFLEKEVDFNLVNSIVHHSSGLNCISQLSRRNSTLLTMGVVPSTIRGSDENSLAEEPTVFQTGMNEVRVSMGPNAVQSLEALIQHQLSSKSLSILQTRWADVFQSRAKSYADLYESMIGDGTKYPFTPAPSPRSTIKRNRLTRYSSLESGSRPARTSTLRSFLSGESRKSRDSRDDSEPTIFETSNPSGGLDGSSRQRKTTLISRVFRTSSLAPSSKTKN